MNHAPTTGIRHINVDVALASPRLEIFVGVYATILLVGAGVMISTRRDLRSASSALNAVAIVLVGWHAPSVSGYQMKQALTMRRAEHAGRVQAASPARTGVFPNIYYIILDGYAREDVLRDLYHYDNRPFLAYLERKGFHVARNAKANYTQTLLSVATTLNTNYVDNLATGVGDNGSDFGPLVAAIRHNRLLAFLRQRGYRIVAFPSVSPTMSMSDAEVHIGGLSGWSEFQCMIYGTTPLPLLLGAGFGPRGETSYAQTVRSTFERLPDAAKLRPPILVCAHIACPHPPFVFDADGRVLDRDYAYRARHAHPTGDVTPSNARGPLPGLLKGDRGFLASLGMTLSLPYA